MVGHGSTGVVVPVSAADALLTTVGQRFPGAVRDGVPAHMSLMYPFVGADLLTERVTSTLRAVFASRPPVSVVFEECARHGGFVYLRPSPSAPLERLTAALQQRWPRLVPYAGRHAVTEPHVTLALDLPDDNAAQVQREATTWLSLTARIDQAWLVAFHGQWQLRQRFDLTAPSPPARAP